MHLKYLDTYTHHIRRTLNTDLRLFEISVWLTVFAQSLISVFVPVILLGLGLTLKEIALFYLLFNAFDVPLNLLAKKLIQTHGARIVIIVALLAQLAWLFVFYNLSYSWLPLTVMALLLAIHDSFYWVGHLYVFVESSHNTDQKLRKDVGTLKIIRIFAALIAPIIGAFVLLYTNQQVLIMLSSILLLASLAPLFRMKDMAFIASDKTTSFKEFFKHPKEKYNYVFQCLAAMKEEFEFVIWPFFIYLVFTSIKTVAFIPTLISIAGIIITLFASKFSVKKNIYRLISYGALFTSIIWLLRINLFESQPFVLISVFILALLAIIIDIPLSISTFERGKVIDPLNSVTYLNMFRMLSRGIIYLILFFSTNFFQTGFYLIAVLMFVFFIAGFFASTAPNSYMEES